MGKCETNIVSQYCERIVYRYFNVALCSKLGVEKKKDRIGRRGNIEAQILLCRKST